VSAKAEHKEQIMPHPLVTRSDIETFQRDGVVLVKGLFADYVDELRAGIARNMENPGPYAAENLKAGENGRFFDDYCNWQRIPEFETVVRKSPAATVAADLMSSKRVQIFHDHILIKEPGTSKPTPWHQDSPYYFVDGIQNVSFWSPLDQVTSASLRCVAGSHKWPKPILPTRWLAEDSFYPNQDDYMPVPDPDAEAMEILEWAMEPGDAVAFSFGILHGARGNESNSRRRAFSLRFVGDDARYVERPGSTSPPFPGHGMQPGQQLREDWFPVLFER
jgi:ectoine hydroxylase-related dioxygenase (phytanoyl-CoA dioxygenase family)|tara:strand:- start:10794 stop:11624 length:831 start_codon:yes stop_codon:yes gene_type:complete